MLKSWLLKDTAGTKMRSLENVENLRKEKAKDVPVPTKFFASSGWGSAPNKKFTPSPLSIRKASLKSAL